MRASEAGLDRQGLSALPRQANKLLLIPTSFLVFTFCSSSLPPFFLPFENVHEENSETNERRKEKEIQKYRQNESDSENKKNGVRSRKKKKKTYLKLITPPHDRKMKPNFLVKHIELFGTDMRLGVPPILISIHRLKGEGRDDEILHFVSKCWTCPMWQRCWHSMAAQFPAVLRLKWKKTMKNEGRCWARIRIIEE